MRLRVLAAAAALAACSSLQPAGPSAKADLQATKGNKASGTATFTQVGDKVRVVADVSGLNPGQEHGFHIHEVGDCSSGDGMSTKGHFNPLGKQHAHYSTPERHAGDMPAIKADASGNAHLDTTLDVMTVNPGPTSIVGRGLIVHAGSDDYKTQPTGNAGARIACGVIQRSS
ncbi:MAG TPA: superoxide dismutase family protein [Burkholderiales bacterium]|nr:superoxide dismutase family protein [Burkholderiales bacterium]